MTRPTKFGPLFKRLSAALVLVVAMVPPAMGGAAGGTKICNSWLPGVFTFDKVPVHKKCWGGWDGCLTSIGMTHNSMKYAVIDFREPGFTGNVNVAVLSNDSRLGPPTEASKIGDKSLGTLPDEAGPMKWLTNWYLPFTGLRPRHYYTVVIYSPDPGYGIFKPFSRQCFLTSRHPDDCEENNYPWTWTDRNGVLRC